MNARYQDPVRGQFLSEDPSFLDLGTPNLAGDVQESSLVSNPNYVGLSNFMQLPQDQNAKDLTLSLSDPQSENSYAYVQNNPIKNVDPNGNLLTAAIFGVAAGTIRYSLNGTANVSGVPTGLSNNEAFALGFGSGFGFGLVFSPSGAAAGAGLASLALDKVENKPLNYPKAAVAAAENYGLGLVARLAPTQLIDIPAIGTQLTKRIR
jgi:hypothetical protein